MPWLIRLSFTFISLLASNLVFSGVSVVVHPNSSTNNITSAQVTNLFLGKTRTLPNGRLTIPIDQSRESETRNEFYQKLTKKNQNQLNAYWARQVFTGKGQPPNEVMNNDEVKLLISDNPSMIGYINSDNVDSSVKVILRIP